THPRFEGTATPGATVTLLARRPGARFAFPIGQARAGADGQWSVVSKALPQGIYAITAKAATSDGRKATAAVPIGGSIRPLVVDTTGPRLTGATLDPGTSRLRVRFADNLSPIDTRGLAGATFEQVTASGATPVAIRP